MTAQDESPGTVTHAASKWNPMRRVYLHLQKARECLTLMSLGQTIPTVRYVMAAKYQVPESEVEVWIEEARGLATSYTSRPIAELLGDSLSLHSSLLQDLYQRWQKATNEAKEAAEKRKAGIADPKERAYQNKVEHWANQESKRLLGQILEVREKMDRLCGLYAPENLHLHLQKPADVENADTGDDPPVPHEDVLRNVQLVLEASAHVRSDPPR